MSDIILRSGKGSPLTNTEIDSNFTNLNADKLEASLTGYNAATTLDGTELLPVVQEGETKQVAIESVIGLARSDIFRLRPAALAASRTITGGSLVTTPGPASIPAGVTMTVEPLAEWLILDGDRSALQFNAYFDRWECVKGVAREIVGRTDVQTLERKTLTKPEINTPTITGGSIQGADIYIDAAVSHTHTVSHAVQHSRR